MIDYSKLTRGERIKLRRDACKLSPGYIAKFIGVSRVTYLYWEDGKVNDIAWPKFEKLAEVLLTTTHWLEYGKANELYVCNDIDGEITQSLEGVHIIKSNSIPVLGTLDKLIDKSKHTEVVDLPAKNSEIFALRLPKASSMCRAHAGDAIILDPNCELLPGEEVFLRFIKDKTPGVLCTFNYQKDGQVHCTTEEGKAIFDCADIYRIYAVIAVARNGHIKNKR
jgi:DNA-binding XRE family transcriptional regulator